MLANKERKLSLATVSSIEKNVQIMTQDELLDFIEQKLKEKRIVSINNLFKHLKSDALDKDFRLKAAYLRYMQLEMAKKAEQPNVYNSSKTIGNYLSKKYGYLEQEKFIVISLDNANHIISEDCISLGTVDRALVSPTVALRKLIENNAVAFFICHNHPSGKVMPSHNDVKTTEDLKEIAKLLKIELLDHFVVGKSRYFSMAENEMM